MKSYHWTAPFELSFICRMHQYVSHSHWSHSELLSKVTVNVITMHQVVPESRPCIMYLQHPIVFLKSSWQSNCTISESICNFTKISWKQKKIQQIPVPHASSRKETQVLWSWSGPKWCPVSSVLHIPFESNQQFHGPGQSRSAPLTSVFNGFMLDTKHTNTPAVTN